MPAKLKRSSGAKALERPFSAKVMAAAKQLVAQYQVVLQCEDGHWYGRGLELPHVMADAKTAEGCVKATRQALLGAVAHLLETGERPPAPAALGQRTVQVNVRLTAEEKLLLEASAKRKGFSGLSDFLRAVAVEASR